MEGSISQFFQDRDSKPRDWGSASGSFGNAGQVSSSIYKHEEEDNPQEFLVISPSISSSSYDNIKLTVH